MFINSLSIVEKGWNIISDCQDARVGARMLVRWLAESLDLSTVGISYSDDKSTYSWTEQVNRIIQDVSLVDNSLLWKHPFPDGSSFWFLNTPANNKQEISTLLDLLAAQWLCLKKVHDAGFLNRFTPKKYRNRNPGNPAWIAVSPSARMIRSRLPELSYSTCPLLILGENGSGKKYLASLIHNNGPSPSEPFTGTASNEKTGTMFVPGWQLLKESERKMLFNDKRRLIAAAIPDRKDRSMHVLWKKTCGDSRSIIEIPRLKDHSEDIPMLASHFLKHELQNTNLPVPAISSTAIEALRAYQWPGNIQELKETMKWSLSSFTKNRIRITDLPPVIRGAISLPHNPSYPEQLAAMEYEILKEELFRQRGNISKTAVVLGLTQRQLSWRIKKYHIDRCEFKCQH